MRSGQPATGWASALAAASAAPCCRRYLDARVRRRVLQLRATCCWKPWLFGERRRQLDMADDVGGVEVSGRQRQHLAVRGTQP
jgi:hypothetical protein